MGTRCQKTPVHYGVLPGGVLDAVAGFLGAALGAAASPPAFTIVIWLIVTGRNGRLLRGALPVRAISSTSAPAQPARVPKIVSPPFRLGYGTSVMKNCDPLVSGP